MTDFIHRFPRSQAHGPVTRACMLCMLGSCILLGACSNKDSASTPTQVAAQVGSDEISIHQINQVLGRSGASGTADNTAQAAREVLDRLIDQQLAVQQAQKDKLDRTSEAIAALDAARRDILARAYWQKIAASATRPDAGDTQKYYDDHPELFSARRIFNVEELVMPSSPELLASLRGMASANKTAAEVAAWLDSRHIAFDNGMATRPAEQISLEILPRVHALRDGQSLVLDGPKTLTYLHLLSSRSQPVDKATALPRIAQFLSKQRANAAIAAELARLKAATTVTYLGEFTKPPAHAASVPAVADVPVSASPPAHQPATPLHPAQSAIEKGVAGLR